MAFGSNLASPAGPPEATLRAALAALRAEGLHLRRLSRFFATPAFPAGAGPDYVNACAAIATDLPAPAILAALHRIEAAFGRERAQRWGARSLDLDLVAVDGLVLPDAETVHRWQALAAERHTVDVPDRLVLPHPRLAERAFVLVPLADIAPGWRHPLDGVTVREMLAALPDALRAEVRPT